MTLTSVWFTLASWLVVPATGVITAGLDRWLATLREKASSSFNFTPPAWGALISNLIVAGLLLILAGLVA